MRHIAVYQGAEIWNRPDEFEISAKGWSLLSRISLMMRAKLARNRVGSAWCRLRPDFMMCYDHQVSPECYIPPKVLIWISGTGNLEFGSQASGTINLCLLPGIQLSGVISLWLVISPEKAGWVSLQVF